MVGEVVLLIARLAVLAWAEPVRNWADDNGRLLYVAALVSHRAPLSLDAAGQR